MRDLLFQRLNEKVQGIKLTSNEIEGGTGCFEIFVIDDGKRRLVHSALRGEGRINRFNVHKVVKKIEDYKEKH
jgi:hypothetical protein